MSKFLKADDFLKLVELGPLVSIDLLVTNAAGHLLVGRRTNRPALGFWFVPGGRISKGESLADAFAAIATRELGRKLDIDAARLVGAYTHLYDDNFMGREGIPTHYVVLAYRIETDLDLADLPADQHGAFRWIDPQNLPAADRDSIHENTRAYFAAL